MQSPYRGDTQKRRTARRRRRRAIRRRIALFLLLIAIGLFGPQLVARLCRRITAAGSKSFAFGQGDDASGQDGSLPGRLAELARQEPRLQQILENEQGYPQELLQMLSQNMDMLDFVLNYPEKAGQVFADTIGPVTKGEFPLLLQYDQRWGYGAYGNSMVAVSGCGPTCLAMAVAGLTGQDTVTPYTVAQYAAGNGYYVPGVGTSWALWSEGAAHFGVLGEELPLTRQAMEEALAAGMPVVCSMRPGDFTSSGHFILITGVAEGGFTVNDPNSSLRSSQLWSYDTLQPQINNLWALSAAPD